MNKINVLIIEQQTSFAQQMARALDKNNDIEVVAIFSDIEKSIPTIMKYHVDVVLLDAACLPLDDRPSLTNVFHKIDVPIIMLADRSVEQTAKTVQAMIAGAVDFFKLPKKTSDALLEHEANLLEKILIAAKRQIKVRQKSPNKQNQPKKVPKETKNKKKGNHPPNNSLVVIGTSTGGPRALQEILTHLPKQLPAPLLIVQHMPKGFTKSLANRLNEISDVKVKEAEDGERIERGTAYIAPGDFHMEIEQKQNNLYISLNKKAPRLGHRPSVNNLFDSVAVVSNIRLIVVILTGMGKDGAEGIRKIKAKQQDAIVLVESEETAIIDGMPSAAIATNEVNEVLRLEDIPAALLDYLSR